MEPEFNTTLAPPNRIIHALALNDSMRPLEVKCHDDLVMKVTRDAMVRANAELLKRGGDARADGTSDS